MREKEQELFEYENLLKQSNIIIEDNEMKY